MIMFLRRELIIIRSEDGTYNNVSEEGLIKSIFRYENISTAMGLTKNR